MHDNQIEGKKEKRQYLRDSQKMAPVVAAKIKEKPLLVDSDNFGSSDVAANFILSWQLGRSVYCYFR